jgi:hypothetical protein
MVDVTLPDGTILQGIPDTMSAAEQEAVVRQYLQDNPIEPEKSAMQSAIDWAKGGQREENIPLAFQANLGLPQDKAAKMTALLATTATDERLKSGISEILPGSTFDKDQYGNLVVTTPIYKDGQKTEQVNRFYPNPYGLDMTDLMQGAGVVASATGLGKVMKMAGVPLSGYLGATTLGATEAGLIEAASSKLSGADFKFSDVPLGALGGAAGLKAGQILTRVADLFKRTPESVMLPNGQLRPEIRQQMESAGINADQATAEMAAAMQQQVSRGVDPTEAARLSAAETLPVPVPLTRGATTGSTGQQLFEDMARKGAYGQVAEAMMTSAEKRTLEALQQNLPEIQQKIAGQGPLIQRGTGGAAAQEALSAQRQAALDEANRLYDVARATGPASMAPDTAGTLADTMRASIRDFTPSARPVTTGIMDEIDDILAQGGDIKMLFQKRQQLANAGAQGTPEQAAATAAKRALDNSLADLVQRSLIEGDDTAIAAWSNAIKNYADFKATWSSRGGILNSLTETVTRDGDLVLKQPPEAVANYILGASNAKLLKPGNVSRDLLKLKKFLPQDEWNQIRQEAFINLTDKSVASRAGQDMFSGVNFLKSWKDMTAKNPEAIKALFTKEERDLIGQFASVAARATGGAVNASNSAAAASGLIQRLGAALGSTNLAQFASRVVGGKMVREAYGGARAVSAMRGGATPAPSALSPGIGGAASTNEPVRKATDEQILDPVQRQIQRTTGFRLGAF